MITRLFKKFIFAICLVCATAVISAASHGAVVEFGMGLVSETIVGRNSAGPYFLAYTNIQQNTLEISVNGSLLRQGKDYKADLVKGILTFNRILISDAVAKATYKITHGKSVKSSSLLSVPLEMELLDTGVAKVKLIGGYSQGAASTEGDTIVGLGSETNLGSGKVSAMMLTGKANEGPQMPGQVNWTDKSLYKVSAQNSGKGFTITTNVLRAGREFVRAGQYGVTAGRESEDASLTYKYGKLADFSMVYQNLNETLADRHSTLQKQVLTLRPGETTQVAIVHSENLTGNSSSEKTVKSTGIAVNQKIGDRVNAVASREEVTTEDAGGSRKVETTHVAASGGTDKVQISGVLEQKDFSNKDSESNLSIKAATKPTDKIGVNLGYAQSENSTVGEQSVKNLNIAVKEGNLLQVDASATQTDSTVNGEALTHSVTVKSNPLQNVQIYGSVSGSETDTEFRSGRQFAIVGKPADYAQITASYSIQAYNSNCDITKNGTIELTPLSNAKFAVGIKSIESGGNTTTIRDYSTFASPLAFLSFDGKVRQRVLASEEIDTHSLNVRMAAAGSLTLEGSYRYNPENDKGVVQNQRSTGMGLRSNIGRLNLYGGYSYKDEYAVDRLAEERTFTVGYKLDSYSSLDVGLSQSRLSAVSDSGQDSYNLGYQRKVGSGFDLLLTGRYVKYLQNATMVRDDVKAEASLSLGF